MHFFLTFKVLWIKRIARCPYCGWTVAATMCIGLPLDFFFFNEVMIIVVSVIDSIYKWEVINTGCPVRQAHSLI